MGRQRAVELFALYIRKQILVVRRENNFAAASRVHIKKQIFADMLKLNRQPSLDVSRSGTEHIAGLSECDTDSSVQSYRHVEVPGPANFDHVEVLGQPR